MAIPSKVVLRLPAVIARTGLSRSGVYQKIKLGRFPKPIAIGSRAVGWLDHEVAAWIDSRIQATKED